MLIRCSSPSLKAELSTHAQHACHGNLRNLSDLQRTADQRFPALTPSSKPLNSKGPYTPHETRMFQWLPCHGVGAEN
jgi:hypothetical protein